MKTQELLTDIALLNMDLGPVGGITNEQAAARAEGVEDRGYPVIFGFMREQLRGNIRALRAAPKSRVAQVRLSETLTDIYWSLIPKEEGQ